VLLENVAKPPCPNLAGYLHSVMITQESLTIRTQRLGLLTPFEAVTLQASELY